MKAVLCKEFGPPSGLMLEDLAEPVAGPGELRIRVRAVGLNFYDTLAIKDRYQYKPALPFSPGGEIAGEVDAVGAETEGWRVGDRVIAYVKFNGCREKLVIAAEDAIAMPAGLAFEIAAGLQVTYGTTVHAFRDRAGLHPGETVAILGASGGVGQSAIEIAKLMGARVIACASSPEKLAFCREMGADETVDYEAEDLKVRLRELTGGEGVDVVYDAVGDRFTEPAVRALAWGGRLLVIGFAAGEIPKIPLNLLLLRGADIRGVFWGEAVTRDPEGYAANMAQVMDWVVEGRLKPHIHRIYPLAETAQALDDIAARRVKGKAVIAV